MFTETFAKRFLVSGTVQGVGFRYFAEGVANRLGVTGFAKNLADGRVEVYAVGTAAQLDALKSEIGRGPRMARVERVDEIIAEMLPEYSKSFTIGSEF